jgi:predicted site-specific integrase-resolvase
MTVADRHRDAELATTAEAAAAIGVHPRTLHRYVHLGKARASIVLPSGRLRWTQEDIERLRGRAS